MWYGVLDYISDGEFSSRGVVQGLKDVNIGEIKLRKIVLCCKHAPVIDFTWGARCVMHQPGHKMRFVWGSKSI